MFMNTLTTAVEPEIGSTKNLDLKFIEIKISSSVAFDLI